MSANITIKEGGQGKVLNAIKKLKISTGNGSSLWLPENDLVLDDKSVTKNGTYKASDDGLYGYSEITVNVTKKTSTSGKKPDGNDYNVETDPNGNIVETKLPSSIKITTNPTKMTYNDGESIDMTGAVIKAYCGDGTLWEGDGYSGGIIPLSEIEINPTTASGGGGSSQTATSDLELAQPYVPITLGSNNIRLTYLNRRGFEQVFTYESNADRVALWITSSGGVCVISASTSSFTYTYRGNTYTVNSTVSYNGKTFYVSELYSAVMLPLESFNTGYNYGTIPPSGSSNINTRRAIEYTMLFGTISGGGGSQTIEVKWERPKDDKELMTRFNVTVN